MNKNAKGHGDFFIFKKVLWDLIESEEKERWNNNVWPYRGLFSKKG